MFGGDLKLLKGKSRKTKMAMDDKPLKDVAPIKMIKKGDFLFPCWSSGG